MDHVGLNRIIIFEMTHLTFKLDFEVELYNDNVYCRTVVK